MSAGFPLQFFNVAFHCVPRRFFANDRQHLGLCHSRLKLRKPLVHLTTDANQEGDGYQERAIEREVIFQEEEVR